MPFGLNGAPATFQCMMGSLLQGMESFIGAYLDDLVVYSETRQEHHDYIRQVLQRLREQCLTAKPSKCQFAMQQCVYLGHVVGSGQVKPETDKLQAVETFPIPTTKQQI